MTSEPLTDALRETLAAFDGDGRGAPRTTTEVADALGLGRRSTYERLDRLVTAGRIETKKVGANARVWWRPSPVQSGGRDSGGSPAYDSEQFAALVDSIEEYAVFGLDTDGRVRTWNPGAERLGGYDADEIVGEHVSTFHTEDDREAGAPEAALAAAAAEGSATDEGWRVRADGSRFLAAETVTAVRGDDGALEGYTTVVRDVTDRREHERRLRRERDLVEQLLGTAPVRIAVLDADGSVERANRRACEEFGVEPEELRLFGGDGVGLRDAEGTPLSRENHPVIEAFETGERVSERVVSHETADGERRWSSVTAAPAFDDDGELERVVVAGTDITALKRRERRVTRERDDLERELDGVFARVSDGFFALDDRLRFSYVNDRAADVLGVAPADVVGASVGDVLNPGPEAEDALAEALDTQRPVSFEEYYEPLDVWFHSRVYPSESGVSVYFRDVTERRERERELEETRRRYLALVDHFPNGAVALVDEDVRYVTFGGALEGEYNMSRADLEGGYLPEVLPSPIAETVVPGYRAALGGEPSTVEAPVGDRRYEFHFYPVHNDDGDVVAAVGMSQDVTERRRRERALEESERRYRTLVDRFPNGIVALFDDDLRYLAAGGEIYENLEWGPEDTVGRTLYERGTPEDVARLEPNYRAALDGESRSFEMEYEGMTLQFWTVPVTDESGEVFAGMAMSLDVTERAEYERYLRDAKAQLEAATEAGAVGTWEWRIDEDRMVTGPSLATTLGVDPDAAREGVPLERYLSTVHEDDRERVRGEIAAAVKRCGDTETEFRVRDADGETRWVAARGRVVGDDDGTPVRFPGAFTDITDRKEAELELERQREQLAALNSLNTIVQETSASVIEQSTREEIEATVCERLAATDSYLFAWIGDVDVSTRTVDIRAQAGDEGYLDDVTISVDPDDPRSERAPARALRTGEIRTTRDLDADGGHGPRSDASGEDGFRSSAAIPIVHEGTTYGVLCVYAERPNAFEGEERAVVARLGEIVGHAIAAVERKRALMSDEVIELEFRIDDVFRSLAIDASGAEPIRFEHLVPVADDTYVFFGGTTPGGVPTVEAMVEAIPFYESVSFREADGEVRFELVASEPPVLSVVASVGGSVEEAVIENGDYRLTVHLSPGADVPGVIGLMRETHPDATLVKRRQLTVRDRGLHEGRGLLGELTRRQRTAVETAYRAGFFEWPRESSGGDVAALLDVASPTFHQHLRKAERTVFGTLLSTPGTAR